MEIRYAEILRLQHPYTLAQVNRNFRDLMKECHPDTHAGKADSSDRAAQLNEALEHFREKLGS